MTTERVKTTCHDCSVPVTVQFGDEGALVLCQRDYDDRYRRGAFDSMPRSMNFGASLNLKLHGRPVRVGVRYYEQADQGVVEIGRRR